jgi:hypothetical protein
MAIPEEKLKTWAKQGSVSQSAQTYEAIRAILDDKKASYHARDYSIFLQGSYGNDTNVWKDSDVDIVIRLNETYYFDTNFLKPPAKENFDKARDPAEYGYDEFKKEVLVWLQKQLPGAVKPGKKAIFIEGNGTRRDADVLVCCLLRQYFESSDGVDDNYGEGICFFLPDMTRIENFPEQHAAKLTDKHQDSNQHFKPIVRVYKNMRNRMIDDRALDEGIVPSYFLEGMLSNVPNENFVASLEDSWVNSFNWVLQADHSKLLTASGFHWLVRDNFHECWPQVNFNTYLNAAHKFWTEWEE